MIVLLKVTPLFFDPTILIFKSIFPLINLSFKILLMFNSRFDKLGGKEIFESKYLEINSKKAFKKLKWKPKLSIDKAIALTVDWYSSFKKKQNLFKLTNQQIYWYLKK